MTDFTPALFRDVLVRELQGHLTSEPTLAEFIAELQAIDCSTPREPGSTETPENVVRHLAQAQAELGGSDELSAATAWLSNQIEWYQILQGDGIEPSLATGLTAGQLAGQIGLVPSDSARAGLFLLSPDLYYPLHQHGAKEFYLVVSGSLTLQHGREGTPFHVGPGEISVTPSNRVHALSTGDAPCLIIYTWIGEVESPSWWWEQDAAGDWHRAGWKRQPNARWVRTHEEPITEAVLREAGETL